MKFQEFAATHGLILTKLEVTDNRVARCPTEEKPRKKNGTYFWDGQRGWVCNWNRGGETKWFNDPDARPFTDEEKKAFAERKRLAEQNTRRRQDEARKRALEEIRQAKPATHPYLAAKGLADTLGLVSPDGALLVPIYAVGNGIISLQRISLENNVWVKKMFPGARAKEGVFEIGGRRKRRVLVEGYATGLSVKKALELTSENAAVVVCFSASNLVAVSRFYQGGPGGPTLVAADNDASGTGQKAARATGLPWVVPDETGMDFNDLHQAQGLVAVAMKLKEGLKML